MIFRNWVLQNFPFLEDDFDALTDYELFCKMLEYVKEFAKDNEEFNKRLTDLENYINNLDLQDEVNNKLDEMSQDGTLENLISQYIQLKTTYVYNNVNDMKNATNLVNGCYARTSGFYDYNDGGGANYKIRTVINEDVINEMNIIALHDNTLVAELISDNIVNVKQYGAKGDDTHDDTLNIQTCFDNHNIVYIPEGKYKTTDSLNITKNNFTLFGDNKTLTFIKKYGSNTLESQISYDDVDFDYSQYPAILNLVFMTNNNLNNVYIHDISLYDETPNTNSGIIAPHISYCIFDKIRISHCSKGIRFGGWINKILNCDLLNIKEASIVSEESIYTVVNGVHGNKVSVKEATGLYIVNSAFDNGYPCFEIINSQSVNIYNCSTETNRMVLRNTNSFVEINGGDLEGHSNADLTLFKGFFVNQNNGETYIRNANIHFDDYHSVGNPTDKNLVRNTGGTVKIIDNKINLPYTYTIYNSGNYTTEIDDKIDSSIATNTKKTGRFSVTDNTTVEVLRLPFVYGKNYMLNIKSWATFPNHFAINLVGVMIACSNADNTYISPDLTYTKASSSEFSSYLQLTRDSVNNELVLSYHSTNAYGSPVYFEIEYTNN